MSPQREVAVGQQAAAQVEREIGLVRDPALTGYVDAIGQRLAAGSPRHDVAYRFAVADMPEPNAFALPGGWVYVSRGLLAYANSEDELANVIGHEIGHVAARHAAQRETRSAQIGILSAIGALAAGLAGGGEAAQMVGQLGQTAGASMIASYSRDQERQADDIGQRLAASAGFDPTAMADYLSTHEREGALHGGPTRRPSFLDSHPDPGERAVVASRRAAELPRGRSGSLAGDRVAFLRRLEGLAVGPDPREGVFEGSRFLHPGLDFVVDFPRGWRTQNARQAVAALAPRQDAVIVLESQGARGDPRLAAQRWLQANPVRLLDSGATRVGGWSAFRALAEAQTRQGATALHLTWIAHPHGTFRVTGMTGPSAWRLYAPVFDGVVASFGPLPASERGRIHGLRLAIATARGGESLAELGRRTGNAWSPDETAVANGLARESRLAAGTLVKIAQPAPLR
jgi:predicted Zn-dependent protease